MNEASTTLATLFERSGPCSAIGAGGVSVGSSPDVMADINGHAGVVSGRKRGWSLSCEENTVGRLMVALISWTPLLEDETRVGWGGGHGGQAGIGSSEQCRPKG